jgi:hypothetical protein
MATGAPSPLRKRLESLHILNPENPGGSKSQWVAIARPHRMSIYAASAAALLFVCHIGMGLVVGGDTGAYFRTADQLAIMLIGVVLAGLCLMVLRARLFVSPDGVMVRGAFATREFAWSDVRGISFRTDKSVMSRLDLPDHEYMPMLAINSWDKERAIDSLKEFAQARKAFSPVEPEPAAS